jgi:hypothetical protein
MNSCIGKSNDCLGVKVKKTDIKKVIDRLVVGNVEKGKLEQLGKVLVIWLDEEDQVLKMAKNANRDIVMTCSKGQDIGIACWPLLNVPELFKIKMGKPLLLDYGRQMVEILVKDPELVIWATCQNGYVKPLALKYMLLLEMVTAKQSVDVALEMLGKTNPEAKALSQSLWKWLQEDAGSGSVREVIQWR